MADQRGICRAFVNEGKCRYGNKCKFKHTRSSDATSGAGTPRQGIASMSSPPSTPSRGFRGRGGNPASSSRGPAGNVPRDVCRVFWGTGTCERLFDCSFKHVKGSITAASNSTSTTEIGNEEEPDFFSAEGLAIHGGATHTPRLALDPSSAHNNIQPFLKDNYRFENPSKMQGFVNVLASITDRNKGWVR